MHVPTRSNIERKRTYRCFLVDGLDDKLLVIEGDVSDLAPGEANFWSELIVFLINVEAQGIHSQPKLSILLIFDAEIVDAVHFKILGNLDILEHCVFSV